MWYNKYIGIPYKDNGRTQEGLDCWGLVRYIYKDKYNIELPSFEAEYLGAGDRSRTSELLAANRENWEKAEEPKEGDVVLFRILGLETHVGIYLGNNKFLHSREQHSSVIENLESPIWKHRLVGFYRYSAKSNIIVNAVPHPFKTQRYVELVEEGSTVEQLVKNINTKYAISDKLKPKIAVILNGKLVPTELWHKTRLHKTDVLEYRAVPQGSNALRSILMIVVMVAAAIIAGPAGAAYFANGTIATALGVSGATVAAAAAVAVSVVGMALVDAIAPIRMPNQNTNNPGSPVALNLFTGGSNRANPYGIIPVVLGRNRITPPLAGQQLLEAETYTSFLKMPLCWGFGPLLLDEATLMVGDTKLQDYVGTNNVLPQIANIDHGPLPSTTSEKNVYRTIYSIDAKQYYPQIELAANSRVGIPGPWYDLTIDNDNIPITEIGLVLNFPEGLRKIYTNGDDAGKSDSTSASFEFQYAPVGQEYTASDYVGIYNLPTAQTVQLYPAVWSYTIDGGEGIPVVIGSSGFRWTRIGLYNNTLVVLHGAITDNKNANPSAELLALYQNSAYTFQQPQGASVYERLPNFADSVIPLYDICVTGEQGVLAGDIIDYRSSITQYTGLNLTISSTLSEYGSLSYTAVVSAGNVRSGIASESNLISLNNNRKDAFNEVRKIPVAPGNYKIRIRRLTDDTTDLSTKDDIFTTLTNDTSYIPAIDNFTETSTRVFVYQGALTALKPIAGQELEAGQFRITSITYNNATGPGAGAAIVENRYITVPPITGLTAATGTRTINLEISTTDNSTETQQLVQTFVRSSIADAYRIDSVDFEAFVFNNNYSSEIGGFSVYKNGNIQTDLYATITTNLNTEAATAAPISNITSLTFAPNTTQFIIRIYDTANKTNILAKRTIKVSANISEAMRFRNYSKAVLYSVTGYSSSEAFRAPKVKNDTGNLVDCLIARTAIKFESTSKINGQIDGVNGVVTSICRDYNSATNTWVARPTNNPASLFLHVLMHPGNAYRITESELSTRVNLANLQDWHTYCVANGFTYNHVMDRANSVIDTLKDIAAAGRASPNLVDGKWSVVIDRPRTDIVQHFTPHNSWGFEGVRTIPRMPDAFRCTIRDENSGYQDVEIVVYNEGKSPTTSEVFEEISLPGVTNKLAAINHLRWHLAQLKYRSEKYTINTDMEYIVCNRGDRVKVAHDIPKWGTGSARIKTYVDSNTVELDDVVYLEANTPYIIRIRTATGSAVVKSITQVSTSGYYTTINLNDTITTTEGEKGNLVLIGTSDSNIMDLVVLSIEPLDNKNARIVLAEYAPEIYTVNLATMFQYVEESVVTLPPDGLKDTITVYPEILSMISDISVATILGPNSYKYNILVNVSPNPANPTNNTVLPQIPAGVDTIELAFTLANQDFPSTVRSYSINEPILIDDVLAENSYKIRIRYKSNDGRVGPWSINAATSLPYYEHTVAKLPDYIDVPDTLDVDLDRTNLIISINRVSEPTANFSHYELRVLKDPNSEITEDFWAYGDNPTHPQYQNIVTTTTISTYTVVNLLNFPAPRFDPDGVMYRIACRSIDNNGVASQTSIIKSFLLIPLS